MTSVFHDKEPRFGLGGERTWPDDFDLVATVDTESADVAFELTNHIDDNWTKNPGVKALVESPRSTSMGDVVVTPDDTVHLVLAVGWQTLGKADKKITIPAGLGLV